MGIFVSGALLGSIVNPLGKSLSKNKVDRNSKFFGLGKYVNFRDLFSIFFVDFTFLKNIAAFDVDFKLVDNTLLSEKHVLGFMADYSKFLISKKTFSVFMDVKDFFKADDMDFVKSEIRSRNYLILFLKLKQIVLSLIVLGIWNHGILNIDKKIMLDF